MKTLHAVLLATVGVVSAGVLLFVVSAGVLLFMLVASVATAQEPDTASVLPATCYEGMCMVKREHLEAVLKSHNAYRADAKRCSKARES